MKKSKTNIKKIILGISLSVLATTSIIGCGNDTSALEIDTENLTVEELVEKAKEEGKLQTLGMPDTWANWEDTWNDLQSIYGIVQSDTDMSSAEEVSKMLSEGSSATSDMGDVGISFGPIAESKDITLSYKTSYWDEIPTWAKDDNGDWIVGYTGTIAVITDRTKVGEAPKTWNDILNGDYSVCVGDVTTATQAQNAVLSAAYAFGGGESNIQPGIDFFAEIAKQGRLSSISSASIANLEKGEIEVAFLWDFNALNYADQIDSDRYEVTILDEAAIMSGYATIINKYANNPYSAMLAREYILSDEGQINLAKGYAKPIRDVELPEEVEEKLLDDSEYENVVTISDYNAWEKTASELPQKWQQEVLIYAK